MEMTTEINIPYIKKHFNPNDYFIFIACSYLHTFYIYCIRNILKRRYGMGHFYVWKFSKRYFVISLIVLLFVIVLFIYIKLLQTLSVFIQIMPAAIINVNDDE